MPKFSFPLVKSSPTDSEYAEICTGGGSRPPCQLKVMAYSGSAAPSDTYGNLSVVNLPLQNETVDCETVVKVFMQTGCPDGTPDVVCDDAQNPTEIAPNSSETIYILDGNPSYNWEIVGGHGYSLGHETTENIGGRPDGRLNSRNTLYSSTDSCGTAQVKITDNCQTELICEFPSSIASDFEYDWVNSAQTVAKSSNVKVFISGGSPPYTWYVSGVGFSLHDIETYGNDNTVYADSTACGGGTITVEDICGVQVNGSVRCTTGLWIMTEDTNNGDTACGGMFGAGYNYRQSLPYDWPAHYISQEKGENRLYEEFGVTRDHWTCASTCTGECDTLCDTWVPNGCVPCLIQHPTDLCAVAGIYPEGGQLYFPCCSHNSYPNPECYAVRRRRLYEWRCP